MMNIDQGLGIRIKGLFWSANWPGEQSLQGWLRRTRCIKKKNLNPQRAMLLEYTDDIR
jgi:hypothetical protein